MENFVANPDIMEKYINDIYDKYSWYGIDRKYYDDLVFEIFKISSMKYNSKPNTSFEQFFSLGIEKKLRELFNIPEDANETTTEVVQPIEEDEEVQIEEPLSPEEYTDTNPSSPIEEHFHKLLESNKSYNPFKEIINYFKKNKIEVDFDSAIDYIKKSKSLETIITKCASDEELFKEHIKRYQNATLLTILEAYCFVNEINLFDVDTSTTSVYTPEEEIAMFEKIRNGDNKAKEEFITNNLGLVKKAASCHPFASKNYDDLFQEGCFGLLKAVDKFNHKKGYKFSTYAMWWIKTDMYRGFENTNYIYFVPVYMREMRHEYRRKELAFISKIGRKPTEQEMADLMKLSVVKIRKIKSLDRAPLRLDQKPQDDDDSQELGRLVADTSVDIEKMALENILEKSIQELFQEMELPQDKIDFLRLRFGFDGNGERTLAEIGRENGTGRENARQIEARLLRKLRRDPRILAYAEYLDDPETALENIKLFQEFYKNAPKNSYRNPDIDELRGTVYTKKTSTTK